MTTEADELVQRKGSSLSLIAGRWLAAAAIVVIVVAVWVGVGSAVEEARKTRCVTNERRLSSALLLYAQDHDGRLPPPEYRSGPAEWRHWHSLLQSYLPPSEPLLCPKLEFGISDEARHGYPFGATYALNERFFGVFGAGPFPLENLELPQQTAMLVETASVRKSGGTPGRRVWSIYTDIQGNQARYPAVHGGRLNVAAADGHVSSLKPAHYGPEPHDPLIGRLGGSIYNWNGGHPNGDTGGPPRE